jgi:hypothetical protein
LFRGPSRGDLVIAWHARSVLTATGHHGTTALVATAHKRFSKARSASVRIHLTGAGRRLLARADRLTLAVRVIFIPAGQRAIVSGRRITLSRR